MEAGADTQQSGEAAVAESEAQHITLAQVKVGGTGGGDVGEGGGFVSTVTVWLCLAGFHSSGPGLLQ